MYEIIRKFVRTVNASRTRIQKSTKKVSVYDLLLDKTAFNSTQLKKPLKGMKID